MTFFRTTLIAAVVAAATCTSSAALAACTVSGNALTCDTQQSAMDKLNELAHAYVPTTANIDNLLTDAKSNYARDYADNVSEAKSRGWTASEKSGAGGTSIDVDAYNNAYNSYLSGRTTIDTSASDEISTFWVTYTEGMFSQFTADGPLKATLSLLLSLQAHTITGAYNYTVFKVYEVVGDSYMVSPEVDYGNGITLAAQYLNLSGDSGSIAVRSGGGTVDAGKYGGPVYGYPKSGFSVAAVPGPVAGVGLLPALLLGLGMFSLWRRSLAV